MKQKDYIFIGAATLGFFVITYTILALAGFVPEQLKFTPSPKSDKKTEEISFQSTSTLNTKNLSDEEIVIKSNGTENKPDTNLIPNHISIAKIGVDSDILIPPSVTVDALDSALTKGAVYYPGSGTLQGGNMFLFGHSTNWKIVNNQAYKTFNGLEKLVNGDQIKLKSGDKTYVYSVKTVKRASENDALVQFASTGRTLTISTCDTFGQKQDRWVVEAELTEVV